ncbi:MAG: glycosyltransferase family 2 protein [Hyphomonadaceae bacterium]
MRLSIVIPVFNEQDSIEALFKRLTPVIDELHPECEVICVDDGSSDGTIDRLLAVQAKDPRVQIMALSRNFGKEAALTAGLDQASGDAVLFMDADLQHPPELIPEFLGKLSEGWDVAYGVRVSRKEESPLRATFSRVFYALMARTSESPLPRDAGDFRILSRRVADALRQLQERQRFMKGLFAWVGFKQAAIPYVVEPRRHGKSSWSMLRLAGYAWSGLISFTSLPLRIWSMLGLFVALASGAYASWIVADTLINGADLPGYPTIVTAIFFLGGVQLLSIGILGEYVARIFTETKQRPVYLVGNLFKAEKKASQETPARVVRLDVLGN